MSDPSLRLGSDAEPASHIAAWLAAPELEELVVSFGGAMPSASAIELLDWLDRFSERWDFRRGRERNEAGDFAITAAQSEVAHRAAKTLGQLDCALPSRRDWDHVVVLGGLLRACITRPAHAAALIRAGDIRATSVCALGAFRRLNTAEEALGREVVGVIPSDELDAMDYGVRRAFELDQPFAVRGEQFAAQELSWETRVLSASGVTFKVVAAPAPSAGRRATTPQALSWFAELEQLSPRASVLLVTTEIYRHYHLVDAVRTLALPFGVAVDCAGMVPSAIDPRFHHEFDAKARLQEIRSSIRALRSLAHDLRDASSARPASCSD